MYYYRGKQECDFITEDKGMLNTAIQVCFELNDGNREREIGGITDAMNELGIKQGLILTYNQEETIANDGREIAVVPVWRWLIEDAAPV